MGGHSGWDAVNLPENNPSLMQMKSKVMERIQCGMPEAGTSFSGAALLTHLDHLWLHGYIILHIFLNEHSLKIGALESMFILRCWVALYTHPEAQKQMLIWKSYGRQATSWQVVQYGGNDSTQWPQEKRRELQTCFSSVPLASLDYINFSFISYCRIKSRLAAVCSVMSDSLWPHVKVSFCEDFSNSW